MQKDFLQTLKLEISKHATLNPYERIAFHKLLSIVKSENGMKILLYDIKNPGLIRKNALHLLTSFNFPEVTDNLLSLLQDESLDNEDILLILENIEKFGNEKHANKIKEFINAKYSNIDFTLIIQKAIYVLGQIGKENSEIIEYLKNLSLNVENFEKIRASAIETLNFMDDISFFETLINENNNTINYSVYKTLSAIADREMKKYETNIDDDTFTVLPGEDDRILLDIRVILGKMTIHFDSYSNESKTAFIMAMISCGHREYIIYTMKALTNENMELIDMTLYLLLANITKIRNPDKLFRNLITLPSITQNDDSLIIQIIYKYYSNFKETRSNMLEKDKVYNYIIVMLDTYFENYRKNYMIPEIMEKDYPENFQKIRLFILNKFTPSLKRKIINTLNNPDADQKMLLFDISEQIHYQPEDIESLKYLIEILKEKDEKALEISISRLIDIDFEKRYLKNRIIRLCNIIAYLKIESASTNLVKMFNYVKKYRDVQIYNSVTFTLTALNYPYMLSELEILIQTGDKIEKEWAIQQLSLYNEHRSLNIILDFLKNNLSSESPFIEKMLNILVKREVKQNKAVNEIAKNLLENSKQNLIKKLATQIIGKTAFEEDLEYLNNYFNNCTVYEIKEGIVLAYDYILSGDPDINPKKVIDYLKACQTDPGIKVRIYSCIIMIKLGNKDALSILKDMMIIKNKKIQREILNLLGNFMSIEIAFFLMSLLKMDYSISSDIIPLLYNLDEQDKKEIDHFTVNLFKKFEGYDYDFTFGKSQDAVKNKITKLGNEFKKKNITAFIIEFTNYINFTSEDHTSEISMVYSSIVQSIISNIEENSGNIMRITSGKIIAYFFNYPSSAKSLIEILKIIKTSNKEISLDTQFDVSFFMKNCEAYIVNEEPVLHPEIEFEITKTSSLTNTLILSNEIGDALQKMFQCSSLPASAFQLRGYNYTFKELKYAMTFMNDVEEIIMKLKEKERQERETEKQLDENIAAETTNLSKNTASYARAMDDIGRLLKRELGEVNKYLQARSTDRELIKNVEKKLTNIYKLYNLETSKQIIK